MAGRSRRNTESNGENGESIARSSRKVMEEMSERSTTAAMEAIDVFNGPMAKMVDQNRAIFQKMLRAMQEESLRFVNRRLEHTSRVIENSRDCQGVSGVMAVQQEWLIDIARDYAEQTKRFAELMRELAEDGTAGLAEAAVGVAERVRRESEHQSAA
jgi:hypothetical protein